MPAVAAPLVPPTAPNVQCTVQAAQRFGLPPGALAGILMNEGGKPGQWSHNTNGSYDLGPAQINTLWLRKLRTRASRRPWSPTTAASTSRSRPEFWRCTASRRGATSGRPSVGITATPPCWRINTALAWSGA